VHGLFAYPVLQYVPAQAKAAVACHVFVEAVIMHMCGVRLGVGPYALIGLSSMVFGTL
jgi:hypothetical protein